MAALMAAVVVYFYRRERAANEKKERQLDKLVKIYIPDEASEKTPDPEAKP